MRLISSQAHWEGMERVRAAASRGEFWYSFYTAVKYQHAAPELLPLEALAGLIEDGSREQYLLRLSEGLETLPLHRPPDPRPG